MYWVAVLTLALCFLCSTDEHDMIHTSRNIISCLAIMHHVWKQIPDFVVSWTQKTYKQRNCNTYISWLWFNKNSLWYTFCNQTLPTLIHTLSLLRCLMRPYWSSCSKLRRTAPSILGWPVGRPSRSPYSVWRRRWRAGRRGSARSEGLVRREGRCGSGGQATTCLEIMMVVAVRNTNNRCIRHTTDL